MSDELLCLPSPEDPGRPKNDSANGGTSAAATRLVNTPATTPVATPSTSPARVPATLLHRSAASQDVALAGQRRSTWGDRHHARRRSIEKVLGDAAYERLAMVLRQEFRAEGPLEEILSAASPSTLRPLSWAVKRNWRHSARGAARRLYWGRCRRRNCVELPDAAGTQARLTDAPLCAAVSSGVLERVMRYSCGHDRGLLRS